MRDHAFDGFGNIAKLRGAVGAQSRNVLDGANRRVDHRAFAGLELEVESHAFERKQQIGEDDCCVDVELFGGGDGHLRGQLRLLADFKQGVMLPHRLILRPCSGRLGAETTPACGRLVCAGRRGRSGCLRSRRRAS